jgi:hypothetical protein
MPSLRASEKNSRDLIVILSDWRHSGFQVFCGHRIFPQDDTAMDNLARYIVRASFSQERMLYLAEPAKVFYRAKDGTGKSSSMTPYREGGKLRNAVPSLAGCSDIPPSGKSLSYRLQKVRDQAIGFIEFWKRE